MRTTSRLIATIFVLLVWAFAGYSVASGPLAFKAVAPAAFGPAACSGVQDVN